MFDLGITSCKDGPLICGKQGMFDEKREEA
jgi:hypothetical protein